MRNIYLIGMRGVGKTTIGKSLARTIHRSFFDTDDIIQNQYGLKPSTIIKKNGWHFFRRREKKAIDFLVTQKNTVASIGGGALMYFTNAKKLQNSGIMIYLSASSKSLKKRLISSGKRPSLTGKHFLEEIDEILALRKPVYEHYADITVSTGALPVKKILEKMLHHINMEEMRR